MFTPPKENVIENLENRGLFEAAQYIRNMDRDQYIELQKHPNFMSTYLHNRNVMSGDEKCSRNYY